MYHFLLFVILLQCLSLSHQYEFITILKMEFSLENPLEIVKTPSRSDYYLFRELSANGQSVKISEEISTYELKITQSLVIFDRTIASLRNELIAMREYETTVIIALDDDAFAIEYNYAELEIDQRVYLFQKSTQEVYETYVINNVRIQRKLGYIDQFVKVFLWSDDVKSNFIRRRSNFHGVTMKAMTESVGKKLILDEEYKTKAPYVPKDQTFIVNEFSSGLFMEVLGILQDRLNFTTILYKRKIAAWGFVDVQDDGTLKGSGIVGDVFSKKVDLAVTSVAMLYERALYVGYLPPIMPFYMGFYVPAIQEGTGLDHSTFLEAFTPQLWLVIIIMTLTITVIKLILLKYYKSFRAREIIGLIWFTFIAIFGGKPQPSKIDSKKTYKLVVFISLLAGLVVWIAYRSYFTSIFSVPLKAYPFQNSKELFKSSWRLIVPERDNADARVFTNAPKNSTWFKISKKNMDDESFTPGGALKMIEVVMNNSYTAMTRSQSDIRESEPYKKCKIEEMFKVRMGASSIVYGYGLPYAKFLKQVIFDITETGQLHQLRKKWQSEKQNCEPLRPVGTPLSFGKLYTLFLIVVMGVFLAMIILLIEKYILAREKETKKDSLEIEDDVPKKVLIATTKMESLLLELQSTFSNMDFESPSFQESMQRIMNSRENWQIALMGQEIKISMQKPKMKIDGKSELVKSL